MTLGLCLCHLLLSSQGNPRGKTPAQLPTLFTEGNRITQLIKEKIVDQTNSVNNSRTIELVGNAYLDKEYLLGHVFYEEKNMGAYMLRYNIFAEEFETPQTDGVSIVYRTSEVKVEMNGTMYIFRYYLNEDHREFGYFEVIEQYENITLLKKYRKVLQEGKTAVTSFDVNRPNRLVDMEDYFLMINNNEIVLIKQSNRKLAKELKNYNVNLKPYLKKNKLNVKNEQDFQKALSFINATIEYYYSGDKLSSS